MTRDDLGCAGLRAELESRVALGCASAPVRLLGVSLVEGVSDTLGVRHQFQTRLPVVAQQSAGPLSANAP